MKTLKNFISGLRNHVAPSVLGLAITAGAALVAAGLTSGIATPVTSIVASALVGKAIEKTMLDHAR